MPSEPPVKRALVVEGGGMRGAYAAGVLVGLHQAGARFDAVYAASSGAASAAYLHAGQPEGVQIWRKHLHGNRLISPWKLARGKRLLDLEYLIDDVFRYRVPLDVARLRAAPTPLWVSVTRASDGGVEYHDARTARDPLLLLKASAALPIAYGRSVRYGGEAYIDGGIADPIPLRRALEDGATDLTVVLTRPAGYRRVAAPLWLQAAATWPYPGAAGAFARLHERYNDALDLVASPPPGVRVRAVSPAPALRLARLTRKRRDLRRATRAGRRDVRRLATVDAPVPG